MSTVSTSSQQIHIFPSVINFLMESMQTWLRHIC